MNYRPQAAAAAGEQRALPQVLNGEDSALDQLAAAQVISSDPAV